MKSYTFSNKTLESRDLTQEEINTLNNEYSLNEQNRINNEWEKIRQERTRLLRECDWTMSSDIPDTVKKSDWVQYRKALRDITLQSDPFNIVYPTPPQ